MSYDEYTEQDYAGPAASIAENYGKLNDHVEANGGSFYFVGLPEQRVYFEEKFPDYLNNHEAEAQTADALFIQALEDQGVRFLNMEAVYDELGRRRSFTPPWTTTTIITALTPPTAPSWTRWHRTAGTCRC